MLSRIYGQANEKALWGELARQATVRPNGVNFTNDDDTWRMLQASGTVTKVFLDDFGAVKV